MAVSDPVSTPSAMPTNKWIVTQVTALAALATMYLTTGSWDVEESVGAVGLVAQAIIGYVTRNDATPGGVPEKI